MKSPLVKKHAWTGFLLTLPAILGMIIFFFIPFVWSTVISLTTGAGSLNFIGFKNYIELLSNQTFQLAGKNTLLLIGIGVPLNMLVSLSIANSIYRNFSRNDFFKSALIFPMVIPTASVVLVFLIFFHSSGIINQIMGFFGLTVHIDFINGTQSFYLVLFIYLWKYCGYNVVLFLSALGMIPLSYYEAAELDGASRFRKTISITLPLISPSLFFIFVISVVNSFKIYREVYVLFGKYPNQSIYMLQHFMNNSFENLNYPRLTAAANLIFLLFFILIFIIMFIKKKAGDIEL